MNDPVSIRRVSYPTDGGMMNIWKNQRFTINNIICTVSSIICYSQNVGPTRTDVSLTLPTGEEFIWKEIYNTGIIYEHDIDILL